MRIEYISHQGTIETLDYTLKAPIALSDFLFSLPAYFQNYSVVVCGKLIESKDFLIAPHHKVWLIKKSSMDIKLWRKQRVKGALVKV